MVQPAPSPAMDEITFKSDTVLSDVHLYTPNQRHLMVRLNGVGQPEKRKLRVVYAGVKGAAGIIGKRGKWLIWKAYSVVVSVFLSQFKLLWSQESGAEGGDHRDSHTEETPPTEASPPEPLLGSDHSPEGFSLQTCQEGARAQLDEDGDLDVVRRPRATSDPDPARPLREKVHPVILSQDEGNIPEDGAQTGNLCGIIRIEHTMATPLEDVGKQVWRGALLLVDYILFQRDLLQGRTVLELGAGTGLASIIAATMAQTVYCTDVGADLLAMCQQNITLNRHLTSAGGGSVKVRELDWREEDLCTDPAVPFSWSEEDISDLYNHTTVLLAAEVFYDDDLTDALFQTLFRLTQKLKNTSTVILSVEKRLNFTLRHLDVTCEAYDHFRASLHALEKRTPGKVRFQVQPVEASFPQRLAYERIPQLELWRILAEPMS